MTAVDFLEGKNSRIQEELSQKMQEASNAQNYELAMVLRDRIRALTNIQHGNQVEYADIKSADIIALARRNDLVCIQVFFVRSGQNCGNVPYFPKQIEGAQDGEILEAFLSSFYTRHIPPKEIILSENWKTKIFWKKPPAPESIPIQKGTRQAGHHAKENALASIELKLPKRRRLKAIWKNLCGFSVAADTAAD